MASTPGALLSTIEIVADDRPRCSERVLSVTGLAVSVIPLDQSIQQTVPIRYPWINRQDKRLSKSIEFNISTVVSMCQERESEGIYFSDEWGGWPISEPVKAPETA